MMPESTPYMPHAVFSVEGGEDRSVPRVMIAPPRYIQGPNILKHLGRYLSIVPSMHAAVLISAGGQQRYGGKTLAELARCSGRCRCGRLSG